MSTKSTSGETVQIVALLAIVVGAAVIGYGLLLVGESALGGAHVAAIGLALALSGLFATDWAADRLDLPVATTRRLSLGFAVFSAILLVAFVVINGATFEVGEETSG